ncbi:MAG: signal peptidase II [Planctomycetaceae bacterium]|nr:signal peptidase II [Planctomycetaceae bacterium]
MERSVMTEENGTVPPDEKIGFPVLFRRFVLYWIILFVGLSLDLGTKSWIFGKLDWDSQVPATWWIIDGVFGFQTSLNQGALFGMGQGYAHVFALFSFVAIAGILVWLLFFRGLSSLFLTVVLGMISAGILGNLYDRLGLHRLEWHGEPIYAVRDWILVMIGHWPWPNFNIADSLLVCGAILLAIFALTQSEP